MIWRTMRSVVGTGDIDEGGCCTDDGSRRVEGLRGIPEVVGGTRHAESENESDCDYPELSTHMCSFPDYNVIRAYSLTEYMDSA